MHQAAAKNHKAVAKKLIELGADPKLTDYPYKPDVMCSASRPLSLIPKNVVPTHSPHVPDAMPARSPQHSAARAYTQQRCAGRC